MRSISTTRSIMAVRSIPARRCSPQALPYRDVLGGVSGERLLLAVALGLDVSCRVALASTVDRGWHRTAAMGVFGAAAASGKLLGLNVEQMVNALGIAFSQSAGNRQCIVDGALTKRLQAGQAASSGVFGRVSPPKVSRARRTSSSADLDFSSCISRTAMIRRNSSGTRTRIPRR